MRQFAIENARVLVVLLVAIVVVIGLFLLIGHALDPQSGPPYKIRTTK